MAPPPPVNPPPRSLVCRRVLPLALALLSGCAGELVNPERFGDGGILPQADGGGNTCPPGRTGEVVLQNSCITGCHTTAAKLGGLDLEAPGLPGRLFTTTSTCGSRLMADKANPADSYLLEKLADSPACGSRMPFNGAALSASDVACLRDWLEAGAP
jgi:hypothetical protein